MPTLTEDSCAPSAFQDMLLKKQTAIGQVMQLSESSGDAASATSPVNTPEPALASSSILNRVDWAEVEKAVSREQANREKFTPSISVFRWWARRPHSLMGAIIDASMAATENAVPTSERTTFTLSDPFSGGGTVGIEATRRTVAAYAQDLYPWPIIGLTTSLAPVQPEEFERAAKSLLRHLKPLEDPYRRPDGRVLSHIMRVRVGQCPSCTRAVYLFPEHLITKVTRSPQESEGFYGCQGCGYVDRRQMTDHAAPCKVCGMHHQQQQRKDTRKCCVHCQHTATASEFYGPVPRWQAVLVQEATTRLGRRTTDLRLPDELDPVNDIIGAAVPEIAVPIPAGQEIRRLTSMGFRTWGDLYTLRQSEVILAALRHIKRLRVSRGCRDRLALAIIGLAEMPAYLCRWDRFHLKTFEGIANHHFAHTNFVVETNLLSEVGRGTLPRRLLSARKALIWRNEHIAPQLSAGRTRLANQLTNFGTAPGLTVAVGSSVCQALPDGSVDLALTDPPYFDDVQYGELARLFHFWLSKYIRLPYYDEQLEAVPNAERGNGADHYEQAIMACLKETRRTLKPEGCLILTFHNRKVTAWKALAGAIGGAGFHIRALAVTRAENAADHSKREGKGMLHDLVIECVPAHQPLTPPVSVHFGEGQEARELMATGLALAEAVYAGEGAGAAFGTLLRRYLTSADLKGERIT